MQDINLVFEVIRLVGSQAALSRRLNVHPTRLNNWINRDKKIPPAYFFQLEQLKIALTQSPGTMWQMPPVFSELFSQAAFNENVLNRLFDLEQLTLTLRAELKKHA